MEIVIILIHHTISPRTGWSVMVAQMKHHHLSFLFFPKSNPLQRMMCLSVGSVRIFLSSLKILISINISLTSTLEPNSTTTYLR